MSTPQNRDSNEFSMNSLFEIIQKQDSKKSEALAQNLKELYEIKRLISLSSKKNFQLENDISSLDKKIALLIKNRITLEEVMAVKGDIMDMKERTITLNDKRVGELYGQLFFILQRKTIYIAKLARVIKMAEIDNLLQTVMFTLYGNQYDEEEEHLLLSMFQNVLKMEFDEAASLSNVLRANTALTRMMTTYTRRGPGQQYLKNTLSNVLANVVDVDCSASLEINPMKVYEGYVNEYESNNGTPFTGERKLSPEDAAKHPEVKAIIDKRLVELNALADKFIDAIIQSLDSIPYGIRWISRQIRELLKQKFPDATKSQVCSLIGGFFLLRYINPAVVSPQAFMLVDKKLNVTVRRNLTLLAKMIQNLANNVQFGGVKEFFMAPLNVMLDRNGPRLNDFLLKITEVEDLNEHLQLDQYLALGKTQDMYINITLNEIYFVHQLLNQRIVEIIDDGTSATDEVKMLVDQLGEAPEKLPRKENANVELKLISNYKANRDDSSIISSMRPEQIYSETKYLLFTLIRSMPSLKIKNADIKTCLAEARKYAMSQSNKQLLEKVKRILLNCKMLVHQGYMPEDDNYAQLRKDIATEMVNYEGQIAKTQNDLDRLQGVLSAIHEHNEFLKSQLTAYEEYLMNVRASASSSSKDKEKAGKAGGSKKSKKKEKEEVPVARGPFKFSHVQLEKDGVIVLSQVPPDRRANIFFSFSNSNPGIFDCVVYYRSRTIADIKLYLDDLLERQSNNDLEYETDFITFNVNLIIFTLNKCFLS